MSHLTPKHPATEGRKGASVDLILIISAKSLDFLMLSHAIVRYVLRAHAWIGLAEDSMENNTVYARSLMCAGFASVLAFLALPALAASDAEFPKDWEKWTVVKEGTIPDNKAALPADLPSIVRETVKTYNWVNDGKGTSYKVRINPAALANYKKRGPYDNAVTAVLDLTNIKVLFVTEHLAGQATYGVYDYGGKDMAGAHPSLALTVCQTCHTGFEDVCKTGVCSQAK